MLQQVNTDTAHAITILQRAEWAAEYFAAFDRPRVQRIVNAVADVAFANARRFAELAVRETGFGVVEDKTAKNERLSREFVLEYRDEDFCSFRINAMQKMIEIPRPAGIILGLIPSTSPVAAVYFKVLSSLMTRNAIIVGPHPAASATCIEATELLAQAAVAAGAPDGAIQVLRNADLSVVQSVMTDPRTKLILATGGSPVVRAAYRSGTPALGVGPGNAPVLVDDSADLARAATDIIASKSFDNSVLCTAESVLIVTDGIADDFISQLQKKGAHLCTPADTDKVREYVYPNGGFNSAAVGRTAVELATAAGFRVQSHTKVLLAPIERVSDDEPLTHEKLCPVLAVRRVSTVSRGIAEAKAILRIVGQGHSAVIHSQNPQAVYDYSVALSAHRISVNAPGSLGSAGLGTHLATSMSVGTGFKGGSATGENLRPSHLIQWSRTAYATDESVTFPDFGGIKQIAPISSIDASTPPYPEPSNAGSTVNARHQGATVEIQKPTLPAGTGSGKHDNSRDEIRRIVLEELRSMVGGR